MTPPKKPRVKRTPPPPTPKTPKPWDIPLPPAVGDDTAEELYCAVGRALTQWGALEGAMGDIFSSLVSAGETEPANRAFGAVMTFRGRIEMIEAAAKAFFFLRPSDISFDNKIYELCREALGFSARRNEIAHGVVALNRTPLNLKPNTFGSWAGLWLIKPASDPKRPLGFVLQPANYTTNKTKMGKGTTPLFPVSYIPDYVYSSVEVVAFAEHFERLAKRARRFPLAIFALRN